MHTSNRQYLLTWKRNKSLFSPDTSFLAIATKLSYCYEYYYGGLLLRCYFCDHCYEYTMVTLLRMLLWYTIATNATGVSTATSTFCDVHSDAFNNAIWSLSYVLWRTQWRVQQRYLNILYSGLLIYTSSCASIQAN